MSRTRFLVSVISAIYFGALIGLTFVPTSQQARESPLLPFIAFFIVGLLLAALMGPRRWWAALGFSVLGTAWIEAAQSIWMPVGYAELSDVLWGSFGAFVGIGVGVIAALPALRSMRSHESPSLVSQAGNREVP